MSKGAIFINLQELSLSLTQHLLHCYIGTGLWALQVKPGHDHHYNKTDRGGRKFAAGLTHTNNTMGRQIWVQDYESLKLFVKDI